MEALDRNSYNQGIKASDTEDECHSPYAGGSQDDIMFTKGWQDGRQRLSSVGAIMEAMRQHYQIEAKHVKDDRWAVIEEWHDDNLPDFLDYDYRKVLWPSPTESDDRILQLETTLINMVTETQGLVDYIQDTDEEVPSLVVSFDSTMRKILPFVRSILVRGNTAETTSTKEFSQWLSERRKKS